AVEIVRDRERAVVARRAQHPACEPADDLAALRVDVVEDELAQVEALPFARQPGDELGRVRRAASDDRELHVGCWVISLGTQTRRLLHAPAQESSARNCRPVALTSLTR